MFQLRVLLMGDWVWGFFGSWELRAASCGRTKLFCHRARWELIKLAGVILEKRRAKT